MSLYEHDIDVVVGWNEAQDIFGFIAKLVVDEEQVEGWVCEQLLPDRIYFYMGWVRDRNTAPIMLAGRGACWRVQGEADGVVED